jgi:hypothetical protein
MDYKTDNIEYTHSAPDHECTGDTWPSRSGGKFPSTPSSSLQPSRHCCPPSPLTKWQNKGTHVVASTGHRLPSSGKTKSFAAPARSLPPRRFLKTGRQQALNVILVIIDRPAYLLRPNPSPVRKAFNLPAEHPNKCLTSLLRKPRISPSPGRAR